MKRSLILSALLLATSAAGALAQTPAQMQRWPHWYVGLQGYVPFVDEADVSNSAASADIDYDPGWGGGVSLGYKPANTGTFIDWLRFEIEWSYRKNDIDTIGGLDAGSDITARSGMFNTFFDLDTETGFIPYIGAGIGMADIELDASPVGPSSDDSVFAYQGMVGVGYAPSTAYNTVFGLGYRYFATQDPEFDFPAGNVESEYSSHNLEVNARFGF